MNTQSVKIVNIAINPCGIGGTETFSRILNNVFKNSKTYSFSKSKKSFFEAPYTIIKKSFYKEILRALTFNMLPKSYKYDYSFIKNSIIIANAPCDFDRIPIAVLKNNKFIYLAHNEPNHIWNHKNYFGKNRKNRLKALQYVDEFVCLSPSYIPTFSELMNLSVEKFTAITHTVEISPRTTYKKFQKKIITICRIDNKQKRFDRFLEVANALPDYSFEIYGMGKDEEFLIDLIKESANISFLGSTNKIEHVHHKNGIFLMTSDYEGLSIAILESLSQATPVIIAPNSFGMARKIIKDNINGFVCEDFNVEAVVEKIRIVENNYQNFSEQALLSFGNYDIHSFKKQWDSIFNKL